MAENHYAIVGPFCCVSIQVDQSERFCWNLHLAFLAATFVTCVTCVTCVAMAFAAGGRGKASSSLSDNSEEV